MSNIVTVLLNARDNISPMLGGLKSRISGLAAPTNSIGDAMGSVGLSDFALNAKLAALAAIGSGLVLIGKQAAGAAEAQTSIIATAGDVATLTGASFDKAKDSVMGLRSEIARAASSLPGDTKGFITIANQLVPAIAGNVGGDLAKLNKDTMELTKSLGVLAAVKKIDTNSAGMASARFIGGTVGLQEMGVLDFFEKNPMLMKNVKSQMAAKGFDEKSFKTLTERQRIDLLTVAAKKSITDETLSKFDGTADGYIQGIKTAIFDQDVGIFGFVKPLKALNGRSGIDAVSELLKALTTLGGAVGKAIGFDPDSVMLGIVGVIDWFTQLTYKITGLFNGNDTDMLSGFTNDLFEGLVSWVNGIIGGLNTAMETINWLEVGAFLGQAFGNLYMAIQKIDWWGVAKLFLNVVGAAMALVAGFLVTAVTTVAKATYDKIVSGVSTAIQWISSGLNAIGEFFRKAASDTLNIIRPIFEVYVNGIKATFGFLNEAIKTITSGNINMGSISGSSVGSAYNAIAKPVEDGINGALRAITGGVLGTPKELPTPSNSNTQASNTFAPVIQLTANAAMSTSDQVDMLMSAINDKYKEYQQGVLA